MTPSHLSISNSKEFPVLLGLLILLLGVAVWVCHMPGARIKLGKTRLGTGVDALRSHLEAASHSKQSLIIFFGNSRFLSCINSHQLQSRLDIPNVTVVNLAQESMSPWQYDVILREVGMDLQSIKVAIIEMDPWMFNLNGRHPITYAPAPYPEEYERYATLEERLFVPGLLHKVKLLYTFLPRYSMKDIVTAIAQRSPARGRPPLFNPPRYHVDPEFASKWRNDFHFYPLNISQMHMNNYEFSPYWQMSLERLLSRLKRAEIPVILVHPPVKNEYYKYVESDKKRYTQYRRLLAYMDELGRRYSFLYYRTPEDCGLDDSVFIDYGHFTKEGGLAFTDVVYEATKTQIGRYLKQKQ